MLVALTFDVEDPDQRPHAGSGDIAPILGALDTAGIRATFFLQGRWLGANPDAAAAIAAAGHLVGNHSYFHTETQFLTARGLREDVSRAHLAILQHTGVDARPWYRLPYGAGAESPVIQSRLRSLGYRHVGWDVDVNDYALDDGPALVSAVAEELAARRQAGATHAIVLLHSWPLATAVGLPELCDLLRHQDHDLVTVDRVPGRGAVVPRSRLSHRARWMAGHAKAALRRSA
jgi:peptidoglycan/xylan/chitin deacetylase (PgdA/CDA1 family)